MSSAILTVIQELNKHSINNIKINISSLIPQIRFIETINESIDSDCYNLDCNSLRVDISFDHDLDLNDDQNTNLILEHCFNN